MIAKANVIFKSIPGEYLNDQNKLRQGNVVDEF